MRGFRDSFPEIRHAEFRCPASDVFAIEAGVKLEHASRVTKLTFRIAALPGPFEFGEDGIFRSDDGDLAFE